MSITKPAQELPWRTIESNVVHQTPWYLIREDNVLIHTKKKITYTYLDHPGAVAIVPVTQDGQVVLIKQYRHTVKEWCWEVPMGGKNDEDCFQTARRELLEEIGGKSDQFKLISSFYACNGTSNLKCDVILAFNVVLGEAKHEETELIEVVVKTKGEVLLMARTGIITDGMSALAILLCEHQW